MGKVELVLFIIIPPIAFYLVLRHICFFVRLYAQYPWYSWRLKKKGWSSLRNPAGFGIYTIIWSFIFLWYGHFFLTLLMKIPEEAMEICDVITLLALSFLPTISIALLNFLYPPPPCEEFEQREWYIDPDRKFVFTLIAIISILVSLVLLILFGVFKQRGL